MLKITVFLFTLFSVVACDDPDETNGAACDDAQAYQMTNFTGLDGCGWMLKQGDQIIEVINLTEFYDGFEEGLEVTLELTPRTDMASICMVGMIAEITCIP